MRTAVIFSVILAAAVAQDFPPLDLPSSCAAALCQVGSRCVEEVNGRGITVARCKLITAKPGQCPKLSPSQVGICVQDCTTDSDCKGSDKCCSNGCGNTCQAPQGLIPVPPKLSCENMECKLGQKCVLQDVRCFRAPCYPVPVCVDDGSVGVKPGQCPELNPFQVGICISACTTDSDCKGSDKCCSNGCGTTCQAPQGLIPVPPKPSCETKVCKPGQMCELQDVQCVRSPCPPEPVCVDDRPLVKPGQCPELSPFQVGICISACTTDSECKGSDKCCSTGCGTTCQAPQGLIPVPSKPSCETKKCKPGQRCELRDVQCVRSPCPPLPVCVDDRPVADERPGTCPAPSGLAGICLFRLKNNCLKDSECAQGLKCCSEGCGKVCKVPVKVKPGQCPKPKPLQAGLCASINSCATDSECPGNHKCCKNGCGATTCQAPEEKIPVVIKLTCDNVKCKAGQKCVMRQIQCIHAPCPSESRPVCVPNQDKPGQCPKQRFSFWRLYCHPRYSCRNDAQCPGNQKCCRTPCGGARCQTPEFTLTCANVRCSADHQCVMKTQCDEQGCFPRPVCEKVKQCPPYRAWINPHCLPHHECSDQEPSGCPSGATCCDTDCGRRCLALLE